MFEWAWHTKPLQKIFVVAGRCEWCSDSCEGEPQLAPTQNGMREFRLTSFLNH
jgi:hypothetical protein